MQKDTLSKRKLGQLFSTVFVYSWALHVQAFDSGSTGADGLLNPVADTIINTPSSGTLNYSAINIPSGVTVTFSKNDTNSPITLLVQNNATIAGTIDVSGQNALFFAPGQGGPGGGAGGIWGTRGLGYGGGPGGQNGCAGHGGSYVEQSDLPECVFTVLPRITYGSDTLIPLLGGSGGGGGKSSGVNLPENMLSGPGGGGGGAILLAVSGNLMLTGTIHANGGAGYSVSNPQLSGGGGGSGGAVRIVTTNFQGAGAIQVQGGSGGMGGSDLQGTSRAGTAGSQGRIRIETENNNFAGSTLPGTSVTTSTPMPLYAVGAPELRILAIAGFSVSETPNGVNDVFIPKSFRGNTMTVDIGASGIPVGTQVIVSAIAQSGNTIESDEEFNITTGVTTLSTRLEGTLESSTATANISLLEGDLDPRVNTILYAYVDYIPSETQISTLAPFLDGAEIAKIKVASNLFGQSGITAITTDGEKFNVPIHYFNGINNL